jgi:hypothetical protein
MEKLKRALNGNDSCPEEENSIFSNVSSRFGGGDLCHFLTGSTSFINSIYYKDYALPSAGLQNK